MAAAAFGDDQRIGDRDAFFDIRSRRVQAGGK
jgi:hypothetical protein